MKIVIIEFCAIVETTIVYIHVGLGKIGEFLHSTPLSLEI